MKTAKPTKAQVLTKMWAIIYLLFVTKFAYFSVSDKFVLFDIMCNDIDDILIDIWYFYCKHVQQIFKINNGEYVNNWIHYNKSMNFQTEGVKLMQLFYCLFCVKMYLLYEFNRSN